MTDSTSAQTSGYAGDVDPHRAWQILTTESDAVLVDVRTAAEWAFVGVPDTTFTGRQPVMVQWNTLGGPNQDFVADLAAAGLPAGYPGKVLFLCRSGQRSIAAAIAATEAGLANSFNVTEGFEGPLDAQSHRGASGWRAAGLPWKQS